MLCKQKFMSIEKKEIEYVLVNPSKNITILVKSQVEEKLRVDIAEKLMKREPTAEQVGFISFDGDKIYLRMAGGEFCGNATMSTAAYFAKINNLIEFKTKVNVSDLNDYADVYVKKVSDELWRGEINMPKVKKIEKISLQNGKESTVVFFDGIAHIICKEDLVKSEAERLVKEYCDLLQVDALGIMFIDEKEQMYKLKPLVYVKKANTLFWENSCASGSSAVGVWLAKESNQKVKLSLEQAGGDILEVNVDSELNVLLKGNIIFIGEHKLEI